MKIYAITNQKGGSGKTTTAVNLAAALGERKHRVLVIDLDPQASASCWLGIQEEDAGRALLDVLTGEGQLHDIVRTTQMPRVELAPSSSWMLGAEKALATELGAETILQRQLRTLAQTQQNPWEYVLLDCSPNLGVLTVNALVAANKVLVPVATHFMALQGLAQLMKTLGVVRERLNETLDICGILPCRVDKRTRHAQDVLNELHKHFGDKVLKSLIHENVRLAEAPSFGQSILQYASDSPGAQDYRNLAREIVRMDKKHNKEKQRQ